MDGEVEKAIDRSSSTWGFRDGNGNGNGNGNNGGEGNDEGVFCLFLWRERVITFVHTSCSRPVLPLLHLEFCPMLVYVWFVWFVYSDLGREDFSFFFLCFCCPTHKIS